MRYQIYGDYGYVTETLLAEFDNYSEASAWFDRYTRRDLGGFTIVEIASFTEDGEYIVHEMETDEDEYVD